MSRSRALPTFRVRLEFDVELEEGSSVWSVMGEPVRAASFVAAALRAQGVPFGQLSRVRYKISDLNKLPGSTS